MESDKRHWEQRRQNRILLEFLNHSIVKATILRGAFMSRVLKFFLLTLTFAMTVLMTQESLAVGFSKGNEIQVNRIYGDLTLHCHNPGELPQSHWVRCSADLWSPGLTDFFVGPITNASKVTLQSTRADGSQKSKDGDYLGAEGRSKGKFNLGISTLTQKPLLREGVNQIKFTLSEAGQTITEGQFTTTVTRGETLYCPHDSQFGSSFDCDFPQSACDRYFEYHNYCQ